MPPKKTSAPKKAAKTAVAASTGPVTDHSNVIAQNAVQPATISTDATTEQHNSAALSEEAVRQRAYELYEERGGRSGRHVEDWFRAVDEIRARHNHKH